MPQKPSHGYLLVNRILLVAWMIGSERSAIPTYFRRVLCRTCFVTNLSVYLSTDSRVTGQLFAGLSHHSNTRGGSLLFGALTFWRADRTEHNSIVDPSVEVYDKVKQCLRILSVGLVAVQLKLLGVTFEEDIGDRESSILVCIQLDSE